MKKRILFSLLISICFSHFLLAQGWENVQTDPGIVSYGEHLIATSDGNYVAAGFQSGNTSAEFGSYVLKISEDGDELWRTNMSNNPGSIKSIVELANGQYLVKSPGFTGGEATLFRVLDSATGNTINTFTLNEDNQNWIDELVFVQPDGGFIFSYIVNSSPKLYKYDSNYNLVQTDILSFPAATLKAQLDNGNLIWMSKDDNEIVVYESDIDGTLLNTAILPWTLNPPYDTYLIHLNYINSELVFTISEQTAAGSKVSLLRFDSSLNQIDEDVIWNDNVFTVVSISPANDGFLICGHNGINPDPSGGQGTLIKTNLQGDVEFTYVADNLPEYSKFFKAIPSASEGYLAVGDYNYDAYTIKLDENGQLYSNLLTGKIAVDGNADCLYNAGENPAPNWMVVAEKDNEPFAADLTDEEGNYSLQLDEGDFVISVLPANSYWGFCDNAIDISFTSADQTASHDFMLESVIDCPEMTINVSNSWMVPCAERNIFIDYCNNGTTVAPGATIELEVDENIVVGSSTLPWSSITNNVILFELGDVAPFECGTFSVSITLPCDQPIGNSYGLTGHIFPDDNCNTNPGYMGAYLESDGICNPNEVTFLIQNTGTAPSDGGKEYLVVEDAVLMFVEPIPPLQPNEIFPINIPANGATYTLIHEQVDLAPGLSVPIQIVEGCGANAGGDYSQGYSNQFPNGDQDPYIDIDRPISVEETLPNTIISSPGGYGTPNYIEPNSSMEFNITFENNTADEVNNLKILVPLNEHLDIKTLQNITSSHRFTFNFEEGNLYFLFSNIELPNSLSDPVNAEGFVSFRIQLKENTPIGTVIFTNATIQYDNNSPIATNQTFHTVGEEFVEIFTVSTTHPILNDIKVVIQPNPVEDFAIIDIQNHEADNYTLEIYTTTGKHISTQQFENQNIQLQRNQLKTGMYIYRLSSKDGFVNTGRIIFK